MNDRSAILTGILVLLSCMVLWPLLRWILLALVIGIAVLVIYLWWKNRQWKKQLMNDLDHLETPSENRAEEPEVIDAEYTERRIDE